MKQTSCICGGDGEERRDFTILGPSNVRVCELQGARLFLEGDLSSAHNSRRHKKLIPVSYQFTSIMSTRRQLIVFDFDWQAYMITQYYRSNND